MKLQDVFFFKMTICQKIQTCLIYKTRIMLQSLWILMTSKRLYDILDICRFWVLYVHPNNEHHRQNSQNKRHWHHRYSIIAHSMNKLNITGNSRNSIRVNSVRKSYIMIQMQTFCFLCCKFEQFQRHSSLVTDTMSVCIADECAQPESNTEKRNSVGYDLCKYKND